METENKSRTAEDIVREYSTPLSIVAAGALIAMVMYAGPATRGASSGRGADTESSLQELVVPADGITLPIIWGDLGAQMVEVGAIDAARMEALYQDRGGFPPEFRKMLEKNMNEKIVITSTNSGYLLNLLWALGLANKNPVLADTTEMMNPAYKGAGGFASTGGWTLAQGNPMNHYNMHTLITLTAAEQALVDRVSRNIYRPCCNNSTHFPDCNHGMAMLGFLELMASQGVNEQDMYKAALAVNSYWFPETYLTLATYMQNKGVEWKDISPQEVLGKNYSSSSGYANIASQVTLPEQGGTSGGCSA
ncbi:hypothetical protein A2678_02505 [Candidatus Kaiserbacteria bacterium RIFCSPHIGHO2_01_FULL_53_31]|uniref:Uncharacterized protein n=1 Tax=Candidatus Kaiserbacteria bacterium RIFCSPHIGHO2_01_FULL_53_31 TaxID=1798481 RepID=A0A1F6CIB8_9BACT|nr:MAG: hypothetical protein A2678_02505 [Candidatus Kaiserbacteria bacterium RIFCSPHIGHO2_01_FULL_53_31]